MSRPGQDVRQRPERHVEKRSFRFGGLSPVAAGVLALLMTLASNVTSAQEWPDEVAEYLPAESGLVISVTASELADPGPALGVLTPLLVEAASEFHSVDLAASPTASPSDSESQITILDANGVDTQRPLIFATWGETDAPLGPSFETIWALIRSDDPLLDQTQLRGWLGDMASALAGLRVGWRVLLPVRDVGLALAWIDSWGMALTDPVPDVLRAFANTDGQTTVVVRSAGESYLAIDIAIRFVPRGASSDFEVPALVQTDHPGLLIRGPRSLAPVALAIHDGTARHLAGLIGAAWLWLAVDRADGSLSADLVEHARVVLGQSVESLWPLGATNTELTLEVSNYSSELRMTSASGEWPLEPGLIIGQTFGGTQVQVPASLLGGDLSGWDETGMPRLVDSAVEQYFQDARLGGFITLLAAPRVAATVQIMRLTQVPEAIKDYLSGGDEITSVVMQFQNDDLQRVGLVMTEEVDLEALGRLVGCIEATMTPPECPSVTVEWETPTTLSRSPQALRGWQYQLDRADGHALMWLSPPDVEPSPGPVTLIAGMGRISGEISTELLLGSTDSAHALVDFNTDGADLVWSVSFEVE